MAIGLAVQKLAITPILPQGSSQEIGEVREIKCGYVIFTVFYIELHVVEDAAEGQRMLPAYPSVNRRSLVFILKNSRVGKICGWSDLQVISLRGAHRSSTRGC